MIKPEYRFEYKIVDEMNGSEVLKGSTYMTTIDETGGCESVELELFAGLRAFKKKIMEEYEATL